MSGVFLILFACFLWAFDTIIRYPLFNEGIGAVNIVFFEHLLLAFLFFPYLWKRRSALWSMPISHYFSYFVIGALSSALGTVCFTNSFEHLNPSVSILLQKLQPLFSIVLARVVLQERIKKQFFPWALVCLGGGVMVSYQDILGIFNSANWMDSSSLKGYVYASLTVVFWAMGTVWGKKLASAGRENGEIMGMRFSFGLLALAPFWWQTEAQNYSQITDLPTLGKIFSLAIISGLMGMYFYYQGLKKVSAHVGAILEMSFPFFAVGVNWLFLGQELAMLQIVGGLILIFGSLVIQLKRY